RDLVSSCILCYSFFFQAEDGIRDRNVTGVQTCALPISSLRRIPLKKSSAPQPLRHPSLESTSAISKHLPLTLPITEHWLMNYQIRQLESLSPVSSQLTMSPCMLHKVQTLY